jgi:predicted RNA polymerase sigma factor
MEEWLEELTRRSGIDEEKRHAKESGDWNKLYEQGEQGEALVAIAQAIAKKAQEYQDSQLQMYAQQLVRMGKGVA